MKPSLPADNRGFSMVELLVVIAIVGALASIALPRYVLYKEKAAAVSCLSNRRHIEMEEKSRLAVNETGAMQGLDAFRCPRGGVYVWNSTDPMDPAYGSVACSIHYVNKAAAIDFDVPTGENITVNGTFENLDRVPRKRGWTYINSKQVDGWSAERNSMEVWASGMLGVEAAEGEYYIELDSNRTSDRIYQEVETEAGRVYEVRLKARARTTGTSDFEIFWGGESMEQITPERGEWNDYVIEVVGNGAPLELAIAEVAGQNDGRGPLLDAIKILPTDEVR
jgi:prepilin-type N-terminal cleavage/methylation domain-containing protein